MRCTPSRGPSARRRRAAYRELQSSRGLPRLTPVGGGGWRASLRPLNFAAKNARGGPRPRPPQDAAPRHPGNRLSAVADWAEPQGADEGRDAATAASALACQSGWSEAAGRTAGPAALRRGCARQPEEAKSGARHLRGEARSTGPEASRRRAPGGARLRPRESPRVARGHGRVRAQRAPPLLHLASSHARCTVLPAVPTSSLLHPDLLFLGAEVPGAASEPLPPAAAASAAAALRLPLPPLPGLGARGGGAGAFSRPLFATCGDRCMPSEAPGPLQVRATPTETTLPPTPGEPGGCKPPAGGRARGSNKDRLQLGPARGAAAAGLRAPAERAPRGAARAELQP